MIELETIMNECHERSRPMMSRLATRLRFSVVCSRHFDISNISISLLEIILIKFTLVLVPRLRILDHDRHHVVLETFPCLLVF